MIWAVDFHLGEDSPPVVCNGLHGHGVQQLGLSRAYLTRDRDAIRQRY